jgi:hypothetical protein
MRVEIARLTIDGKILSLHMRYECIHYKLLYESPLTIGQLVIQCWIMLSLMPMV